MYLPTKFVKLFILKQFRNNPHFDLESPRAATMQMLSHLFENETCILFIKFFLFSFYLFIHVLRFFPFQLILFRKETLFRGTLFLKTDKIFP